MEADFSWPAGDCSSVSGLQDSSGGLVILGSCSTGVKHSQGWEQLAKPLRDRGALPQSSQNWQDCSTMEADFPWSAGDCSSISGLWDSSSWGCWALLCRGVAPPEVGQEREGKTLVMLSFPQVVSPALWDGRHPQVRCMRGGGGKRMHWEVLLSASWQASVLSVVQGVFYGGPPLLLSPPQHWCLVSPAVPALLPGSLCYGFPLPSP